ncbi:MAG: hypothetical protein ABUL60_22475 [Myxococcales bacterium]
MKRLRLPCTPFVIAVVVGVWGCGETKSNGGVGAPSGDGGEAPLAGGSSGTSGNSGDAQGGMASEPTYAGAVLAMVKAHEGTQDYVARAVFSAGPRPTIGGCPQCCCRSTERGLPFPDKPPDASEIRLSPAAGLPALATLVPEVFEDGRGVFHGMSDLGWSWFAPLSDYAAVTSQPWHGGDTLAVQAHGNEVAPFSGLLRAGVALAGVTPAIGAEPVVIDHAQPFQISWTPEGNGEATVLLGIPNATGICYCDAPDSAGTLVVPEDLLSPISGEISLARLTISNVASSNASIDLVGAVVQTGPFEAQ